MLEKIDTSVIFYALYIASKQGKTGIAVTVDVWEITRAGVATEIVTAGNATEIGDGLYRYLLAAGSVDTAAEYIAVFKTADATVDQQHMAAVWVIQRAGIQNLDATVSSRSTLAQADILSDATPFAGGNIDAAISSRGTADPGDAMALTAGERTTTAMVFWNILTTALTTVGSIGKYILDKLGLIGSGNIFVVSAVAQSGNVTVVKGDSYLNVDGRRLEWTNTSWNVDVASTIQVIVQDVAGFIGVRLSATQIGLELSSAQTSTLEVGENYLFSVQEVRVGGEVITRVQGKWKTTIEPTS